MKKLKIGDLAKELQIKKSLIRQWEKEFGLSTSGQNAYSVEEKEVFVHIKDLVKTKGLSVKQALVELEKLPELKAFPAQKVVEEVITPLEEVPPLEEEEIEVTPMEITPEDIQPEAIEATPEKPANSLKAHLSELKNRLVNLKKLLD